MKKYKILSVIPARGGSKSIPKKNISKLGNNPLISYSIAYSQKCNLVSKTIVSTDNDEIASVAKNFGAEVPFTRPIELSDDISQDYGFMRHALDFFDKQGIKYDLLLILRPTSPLRPKGLIEKGVDIFINNPGCSSVRSIAPVKEHPYRCWKDGVNGSIESVIKSENEIYNLPRQILPKYYYQTGDLELIHRSTLLSGSVSGANIYPLMISHEEMIDIDTQEDQKKAEEHLSKLIS